MRRRWTDLDIVDYLEFLKISGDYRVREMKQGESNRLVDKKLSDCDLNAEGVLVLDEVGRCRL